jgi:hypothetical protein
MRFVRTQHIRKRGRCFELGKVRVRPFCTCSFSLVVFFSCHPLTAFLVVLHTCFYVRSVTEMLRVSCTCSYRVQTGVGVGDAHPPFWEVSVSSSHPYP